MLHAMCDGLQQHSCDKVLNAMGAKLDVRATASVCAPDVAESSRAGTVDMRSGVPVELGSSLKTEVDGYEN